jgi:hypothetical protein
MINEIFRNPVFSHDCSINQDIHKAPTEALKRNEDKIPHEHHSIQYQKNPIKPIYYGRQIIKPVAASDEAAVAQVEAFGHASVENTGNDGSRSSCARLSIGTKLLRNELDFGMKQT